MRKWSHRYCTSYFHISDKSGTFQFLFVDLPEKKGTFWNQWKSLIKSLTLIFGYDQWSFLFWDKFEHLSLPEVVHHWKHHKDRIIGRSCNQNMIIIMITINNNNIKIIINFNKIIIIPCLLWRQPPTLPDVACCSKKLYYCSQRETEKIPLSFL